MNNLKDKIIEYIDDNKDKIIEISHKIWDFAELSLKEYQSAALYVESCKKAGFNVIEGFNNIDTAFKASYGSGRPYIGILAEYDALSGLSQEAEKVYKKELICGGNGHGCGHNMLGSASFGAACAVKKYLEDNKIEGTIILYGCPGEEGGASKAFMARDEVFKELDIALTWHPADCNEIITGTCNSCIQVRYTFKGISAHAAGNPEMGRSALDAVELLNIGVQFLREHMKSDCRIHYAILNTGGVSPNVVQSEASVLYMVRSIEVKDSIELQSRVDKIAEGAALMTDTTFERQFIDGTANTVPNMVLEKLLYENMKYVGVPKYNEAEIEFANELSKTYEKSSQLPGIGPRFDTNIYEEVLKMVNNSEKGIYDFILPFYSGNDFTAGSTDVGDVSWLTPTAQFNGLCFSAGAPGHSWQNTTCGNSSIGDKGTIQASKILALSCIDLFENKDIISKAKEEYNRRMIGKEYICPIPNDAKPIVL